MNRYVSPNDFIEAARLVVEDQRRGGAGDSIEALAHVWETLSTETLVDYGDELTNAYRVVLQVWERGGR